MTIRPDSPTLPGGCMIVIGRSRPWSSRERTPGAAGRRHHPFRRQGPLAVARTAIPAASKTAAINILKTGEIRTKRSFGDCQFHVEWATPAVADGDLMNWGNSGVFFLAQRKAPISGMPGNQPDGHELQIIESHDSIIYADGIAGAIYGQTPPLVNVARKPGQWQTFDVVFTAPRFQGQKLVQPARFTVFWNGVLVQYHTASLGPTLHRTLATYYYPGNHRADPAPAA